MSIIANTQLTGPGCLEFGPKYPEEVDSDIVGDEKHQEAHAHLSRVRPLSEMDTPWFIKVDLNQAKNIILSSSDATQGTPKSFLRFKWPYEYRFSHLTDSEFNPAYNRLENETVQFVMDHGLATSVAWLQIATPQFFRCADFEIDLLPAEDNEDNLLGLKVYSNFTALEFRERRHGICEAMLEARHKDLHRIISIFQRRTQSHGREPISLYSTLAEV